MSKTSLHPDKAIEALHIYRGLRKYHMVSEMALRDGLPMLICQARAARLKWREIAEAAGVSRSYVMRVWKESNGEKI